MALATLSRGPMLSAYNLKLPTIKERQRFPSPAVTPQGLAWDGNVLWMSSRDLGTLYKIGIDRWSVVQELDPPGLVWPAVATNGAMDFHMGKGVSDDRE